MCHGSLVCRGSGSRAKTIIRLNERINGEIIPLFWPCEERTNAEGALFTFLLPFLMAKIDGMDGRGSGGGVQLCTVHIG